MSSVPSSAQARCLEECFGSEKGRRFDAHIVALVWAIVHPPPLASAIEVGIRGSGGESSTNIGVLSW